METLLVYVGSFEVKTEYVQIFKINNTYAHTGGLFIKYEQYYIIRNHNYFIK